MNKSSQTPIHTKELIRISLSVALIYVATLIKIPLPTPNGGGLVHLGTGMSYIIILLFGKKTGAIASSVGMGLFDILSNYAIWAPTTIITRAIMGYVAGAIATKNGKTGDSLKWNVVAMIVGGVIMISGYYIGEALVFGNWMTPVVSVGGNILQIVVGGLLALLLVPLLKRAKIG